VLGVFAARPLFALMNPDPHSVEVGAAYLSVVLGGVAVRAGRAHLRKHHAPPRATPARRS
jgi:Na+-driven multidrug efflux pump